ncbi:hypothetical protein MKW92_038458 [Papaver armeniacum]|nr:hypothetical protein MKW92_038458 [Papaver armeniacum]
MAEARRLFEEIPDRTVVSWTIMISGLLSASAHLGSADIGIWIHTHLKGMHLPMTDQLNTALIEMWEFGFS